MSKRARYLLDTNVISHAVKADWNKPENHLHWINRHLRLEQERSCLPSVAVQEIIYGIHRRGMGQQRQAKMNRWLKRLPKLDFDDEAARIAGELEADLESRGITIGTSDVQIAATALRYDLTLVTDNVKHFSRIPKLRITNWADMPISAEGFFKEYIFGSLPPVYTWVAVIIACLAYMLTVQPLLNPHASEWLPPFLLSVSLFAVVAAVIIGLAAIGIVKVCIILRQRQLI